ncbi:cell division protein FtsL [Nitrospinota bacterium]
MRWLRAKGRGLGGRKSPKSLRELEFPISRAAACISLVAVSALALAWPHLEMVRIGYEVALLKAERDVLAEERRVLRVEIAALRQLDRIEAIARRKLGMIFPRPDQIVYVTVPSRRP